MHARELLIYGPLLAALAWAAVEDLKSRRIRNVLTFGLAAAGVAQSFLPLHSITPLASVEGIGVGIALMIVPFAMGALGGGDLKLLAAVGAWLGPEGIVNVFLIEALLGMACVVGQSLWQGKLTALVRNSTLLAINLAHVNELGMEHVAETGSNTAVEKPLPYAVPVFVAAAAVVAGFGFEFGRI